MSITVIDKEGARALEICGEDTLSVLLNNNGFYVQQPCGGRGTCGKCLVKCNGEPVLACRTRPENGMTVDIRDSVRQYSILSDGVSTGQAVDPVTGSKECYCAAVDIGTTTVVAQLLKMPRGDCVDFRCELNAQSVYGADVISRIEFANGGGLDEISSAIRSQLKRMLDSFGVAIEKTVVTGNTAMLHLYSGLSVEKLAVAPFIPSCLFGEWYDNAFLMPCISAFIGADTVSAILSSGMLDDGCSLVADIGTNGELAYFDGKSLRCCSVAAGPAFEGAGISQGVTACDGAINKVFPVNSALGYTTLGGKSPIGICGSGLMDAVDCMLSLGELERTGYLEQPYQIGDSGVFITPLDIQAVQLAKSAVRTGIDMLAGDCKALDKLYIAGGFGSNLNIKSCVSIGLIPASSAEKTFSIGNAALSGAVMLLKNAGLISKCVEISRSAETLQLSGNHVFAQKYVDNMFF